MTANGELKGERRAGERRRWRERRRAEPAADMRIPGWNEQRIQFLTRYLFVGLGLIFFHRGAAEAPLWNTLHQLDWVFATYVLFNTAAYLHARRKPGSPARYRIAMWVDIALVTLCVLNDPHDIPPSVLVYIMVVLGNGMRYGMRLFGEAVAGCFAGAMIALSLRYSGSLQALSTGVVFLNLFGAIILIYAYILMSRIESSRRMLIEHSRQDTLTGLLNRRALDEAAARIFEGVARSGGRTVVMFADLDRFKAVNDTLGHTMGDRVLAEFARILRTSVRKVDLAARYGGDEFVVVLPGVTLQDADAIAARVRRAFRAWTGARGLSCDVTIGLGESPRDGHDLTSMLDSVDRAMYASKGRRPANGEPTAPAANMPQPERDFPVA